jgi:hypothetical protein
MGKLAHQRKNKKRGQLKVTGIYDGILDPEFDQVDEAEKEAREYYGRTDHSD